MRIHRPGNRILTIGNPGLSVISPRGGAAAISWYLAGGVSAANCLAAYQPKGAASYAASKANLANPGTFTITEKNSGVEPSWSSEYGWYTYQRADDPTLLATLTGETIDTDWSIAIKFIRESTNTGGSLCSNIVDSLWGYIARADNNQIRTYWGSSFSDAYYSGYFADWTVFIVSGGAFYIDGSLIDSTSTVTTKSNPVFNFLGTNNYATGGNLKVAASSIYKDTLTAGEISAITTAMAAL